MRCSEYSVLIVMSVFSLVSV